MSKKAETKPKEEITLAGIGRSTKDTIESIVIAFVLAFVFRAFIVEAYRIPTGSMAPTLYGAHLTALCPDCGYEYAYEIQQPVIRGQMVNRPPRVNVCPNCRFVSRPRLPMQNGQLLVDGGDRILVMKLGYELADVSNFFKTRTAPRRWDVVVFKNPADPSVNFIKRLIGLPGEKIEILDGDVYVNGRIARKTPVAQEPLWFLVYNNDYFPIRRNNSAFDARDVPGWLPVDVASEQLWETGGRVFIFHGYKKNPAGTIIYNGPVQDFYGYDDPDLQNNRMFNVSDLRLRTMINLHKGTGQVDLVLSKWDDVFIARIDTAGKAQLFRTTRAAFQAGKPNLIPLAEGSFGAMEPKVPRVVAFENVDYRVRLTVDDQTVLQTTDEQYHPDPEKLRNATTDEPPPLVEITARDLDLQLWHTLLQRDVFYRSTTPSIPGRSEPARERPLRILVPTDSDSSLSGQPGHGVAGNPIQLGPRDYFVLGDNSPESLDSRLWYEVGPHLLPEYQQGRYQMGTVPADQMVGKAFFVYWPAGFRLFDTGPALIPNVGEMRFIR